MTNNAQAPIELSIVTPVYQAERFIEEFYRRMSAAAVQITPHYEIIFVNDGSTDRSLEHLVGLHEADARVVVVDLSRNFGQHHSIRTGMTYARGNLVFALDCDLEEEPEWLDAFYQILHQEGS